MVGAEGGETVHNSKFDHNDVWFVKMYVFEGVDHEFDNIFPVGVNGGGWRGWEIQNLTIMMCDMSKCMFLRV